MALDDEEQTIWMESGVSAFTGLGFVTLSWNKERAQMTPEETRTHALWLLETAEAAESDAAVFRALRQDLDLDPPTAMSFIASLRQHRGKPSGAV
jgi:hypothetical protein